MPSSGEGHIKNRFKLLFIKTLRRIRVNKIRLFKSNKQYVEIRLYPSIDIDSQYQPVFLNIQTVYFIRKIR